MNDTIEQIRDIFYEHSIRGVVEALFITDVYQLNIAAPVRMSFLWEVLRHSDPSKYKTHSKLQSYNKYNTFINQLVALCPDFPMYEDNEVRVDWGDVRYRLEGETYRFFYNGDLENPYDYLMVYERFVARNNENILQTTGRSPLGEMRSSLRLQEQIIGSFPCKFHKRLVERGNLQPADKAFWQSGTKFYEEYGQNLANLFNEEFLSAYSKSIIPNEFDYEEIPELFISGAATPYMFLEHGGKRYLSAARRANSIFFAGMAELLKEKQVEFSRPLLNKAVFRFLDERFTDVLGPLVVDAARNEESLEYAAAFRIGDKLNLVYVTDPVSREQLVLDDIYERAAKDITSLNQNNCQIFDLASMGITGWEAVDGRKLASSVTVVAPFLPTAFTTFEVPRNKGISVILADEFYSIFDDLEDLDEYAGYLEFKERMTSTPMPMAREIDKYAAYRESAGTLVRGARQPNMIGLMGGMGGSYRFDKLKKFWTEFPRTSWGGNDPTSWMITGGENDRRIYYRADRYMNTMYARIGRIDLFALAPYHLFRDDSELVKAVDLIAQIANDYFVQLWKKYKFDQLVPFSRLKIISIPQRLLVEKDFKQWHSLDPGRHPWKVGLAQTNQDELPVCIVVNKDAYLQYSDDRGDNSLEVDIVLDVLSSIRAFNSDVIDVLIKEVESRRGLPRRFSIDKLSKRVSFPEFAPTYEPAVSDYKLVDNEIAQAALSNGIKPGTYEEKEAVQLLNRLRDIMRGTIDAEVKQYDLQLSMPLLISGNDALSNKRDIASRGLKLALKRDVDFDINDREKREYAEYQHFGRCSRYLLEKFIQHSPTAQYALHPNELRRLIALTDRLLSIYQASSVILYALVKQKPRLKIDNNFLVEIVDDEQTRKDNEILEKEEATFRLKDKLSFTAPAAIDVEKEMTNLNDAFLSDYGFEFKNMGAVLGILATWADRTESKEATYYSAGADELVDKIASYFSIKISSEEIGMILEFLTLKKEQVLFTIGDAQPHDDIPIWEHKKRPMRYTLRPLIKISNTYYWGAYSCNHAIGTWSNPFLEGAEPYNLEADSATRVVAQSIKKQKEEEIVTQAHELISGVASKAEKEVDLNGRNKKAGHPDVLGDYDVLAFIPAKRLLLNVECKFLVSAHSYRDAFTQAEDFFDDTKKRKYLFKVERRHQYLKENTQKVFDTMKWEESVEDVTIATIIVVNQMYAWTRFPLRDTVAVFMDLSRLKEYLDEKAT